GLREARSPNSALLPEHALFIDLLQRRRNAARCPELVDRASARRTGVVVVDDDKTSSRNLVVCGTSASIVDSYKSPSSRSTASRSIGAVASVFLNHPLRNL